MFNTREKRERSLGVKLNLKPERCQSAKCATVRRPARPGIHGRRRRNLSEYGEQLREKQRLQFSYGLRESAIKRVFREAVKNPRVTNEMLLSLLERRLDNVVFRLGIAPSRSVGRQLVSHGHIMVDGQKVTVPSFRVRSGQRISVRQSSSDRDRIAEAVKANKNYEPPTWLALDPETLSGTVKSDPSSQHPEFDVNLVVDYYSK